mmetsp:Transcript_28777/g.72874  ORF Transcript_28777/g.72874 Transcript_28777/m.72874 type:complete len:344 (+) Transcript_28777:58-1089(+)
MEHEHGGKYTMLRRQDVETNQQMGMCRCGLVPGRQCLAEVLECAAQRHDGKCESAHRGSSCAAVVAVRLVEERVAGLVSLRASHHGDHADGTPHTEDGIAGHEADLMRVVLRQDAAEEEAERAARLPHGIPDAIGGVLAPALLPLDGVSQEKRSRRVRHTQADTVQRQPGPQRFLPLPVARREEDAPRAEAEEHDPDAAEDHLTLVEGGPDLACDDGCTDVRNGDDGEELTDLEGTEAPPMICMEGEDLLHRCLHQRGRHDEDDSHAQQAALQHVLQLLPTVFPQLLGRRHRRGVGVDKPGWYFMRGGQHEEHGDEEELIQHGHGAQEAKHGHLTPAIVEVRA